MNKALEIAGHGLLVVGLSLLMIGLPAAMVKANVGKLFAGDADLVSSPTVLTDAPSGTYTILINKNLHTDDEVYGRWLDFLAGKDVPLIMEDACAYVLVGDTAGLEMAESLASRLAAHQLTVLVKNPVMGISKARAGDFDILVMSDEMAASMRADELMSYPWIGVVRR